MTERVAVYVDGSNVYFAQKESLGWWIDWPRFLDAMREGTGRRSAHAGTRPTAPSPNPSRIDSFTTWP